MRTNIDLADTLVSEAMKVTGLGWDTNAGPG